MSLVLADAYTVLALHVLAHVPRPGPGDLYDPRYIAWSAAHISPAARHQLQTDAALLATLPGLADLDLFPFLHNTLAAYQRTTPRALADLHPDDVAAPTLLRALQSLGPTAELMHIAMSLQAPGFARIHAAHLTPWSHTAIPAISPWLTALASIVPDPSKLKTYRIELAPPLGPRGRAFADRILIGCPDPLTDPISPAIVALHEYAVCTSGHVDYTSAEWHALTQCARWCTRAPPPLRSAHARWLATLDLTHLITAAQAAALITETDATTLRTSPPSSRADLLRALRA